MKAVGYVKSLPPSDPKSLFDFELPTPEPRGRDLLVAVHAVSVNPIDTKVRMREQGTEAHPKILGYDCAGVVLSTAPDATLFNPGDEVFYAGSILRPGTNSEFHLVDERLVGHKPKSLSFAEAAALPLTSLTAWELLFDRLRIPLGKPQQAGTLLVIGASGGVGSILVQLAHRLTGLTIIGSASRPESHQWVRKAGAHHIVDHSKKLADEVRKLGFPYADFVISLTHTDQHYDQIVDIIAPQGAFALIDSPPSLDANKLKPKSASLHWELMFVRSTFQTADMIEQHRILEQISTLVDAGLIHSTLGTAAGHINAKNLRKAHAAIESNRSIGKIVLEGF
ncbi:MAG: zinc-binding alcohol dehydrogenase family protein [Acidobacteria bacterium]|nr:MAG: zinc-binding alcohol dehydrogenase family protein [Acidobacteriota bacterium]